MNILALHELNTLSLVVCFLSFFLFLLFFLFFFFGPRFIAPLSLSHCISWDGINCVVGGWCWLVRRSGAANLLSDQLLDRVEFAVLDGPLEVGHCKCGKKSALGRSECVCVFPDLLHVAELHCDMEIVV